MRNYKDLQVWEKAHKLPLAIYQSTYDFPREERFGLTSQIWRSSASIAANLTEGCEDQTARCPFHSDFNGFGDRSFPITCYSRETGFLEECGIFQAELRSRRSDENAIFAIAKD